MQREASCFLSPEVGLEAGHALWPKDSNPTMDSGFKPMGQFLVKESGKTSELSSQGRVNWRLSQ